MAGTTSYLSYDSEYIRPFGPNAPWNIPISKLEIDPDSDHLAKLLWNDSFTDRPERNFNINNTSYTYPVYEVTEDTKYYKVKDLNGWGNLGGEYIPFDPSWKAAPGSDAQIIILDPATGREWDLWQASFNGSVVTISNGNLVTGYGGSDSYFEREVGFEPSRGAGIQYLAMLVRPEEVAQGRIEHALSMPIRNTSGAEFVSPATKIEFEGMRLNGIPEGTRFALDVTYAEIDRHLASLPDDVPQVTIDSLRVIMVALKEYGWFITDTAGSTHFQLESTTSAKAEWAALGMIDTQYNDFNTYPRDALDGLLTKERIVAYAPSELYPDYNPDNEGLGSGKVHDAVDAGIGAAIVEKVFGGRNNDVLNGGDDDENFFGRRGNDKVFAKGGDDKAFGGKGNDGMFGGIGNDLLNGKNGRDYLFGGAGNDRIIGGGHRDVIAGGTGNDTLTGGSGADRFVYKTGWGYDEITDFKAVGRQHDTLDLRGLASIDSWDDLVNNHMFQNDNDVVIDGLNGDEIVLFDVNINHLDRADFLI
ncbi:calcium-binding protein [Sinisalibacter aestuarii]|uniref:Calcium-binding protein n=1 Tax=Sinisalibacter aestuarii TaxID=2949426 RepID=A0ABQ5LT33_9RHOB|nr:calcium-binding protein [Sinisalibacter aestuarii]GKY88156.1 hypothetical protein STA1M1_20250 [Sinisalibacter aestuarii]